MRRTLSYTINIRPLFIFTIVMIAYLVWRSSTGIVWDDTSNVARALYLENGWLQHWNLRDLFHVFAIFIGGGYRPLSVILANIGIYATLKGGLYYWATLAFTATIQGATAASFYMLARKILRNDYFSIGALLLLICSAPFQGAAWVIFSGIQSFVPLFFCTGLLIYWHIIESKDRAHSMHLYYLALALLFFIGPWLREFIGLLSLLIFVTELLRARRPTPILAFAALGFLHALFPMAIVKVFFYHSVPLKPIYSLGLLSKQLHSAIPADTDLLVKLVALKWQVPPHMIFLLPPTFFVLTFIALYVPIPSTGDGLLSASERRIRLLRILYLAGIALTLLFAQAMAWLPLPKGLFWLWVTLLIPLYGLRRYGFLSLWFLMAYLPFLKIYAEEVHLLYALIPATLIVMLAIRDIWTYLSRYLTAHTERHSALKGALRYVFLGVVVLLVCDQTLTAVGSYRIVNRINSTILHTANWFRKAVPDDSIVITNPIHGYGMQLYSNHAIDVYFINPWNTPKSKWVNDRKVLNKLYNTKGKKHPIYILDGHYNFTAGGIRYDNYYIRHKVVPLKPMGRITTIDVRYPYLDPLKLFAKRPYVSFLGSPDQFHDFYHGPARDGTPFMREVFVTYNLFYSTDKGHSTLPPPNITRRAQRIRTIQNNYHGYDLLRRGKAYLAIPRGMTFKLKRLHRDDYTYASWFVAGSLPALKRLVEATDRPKKPDWSPWTRIRKNV